MKLFKVIYAEVRPDIFLKLEKLSKRLDLPKNKVISLALNYLDDNSHKIAKLLNGEDIKK